ncbi:MAG: hypothetical protein Q4G05_06115 [Clostridia bacterium]|nr:hypothetical protein [Clostridia bacterium]
MGEKDYKETNKELDEERLERIMEKRYRISVIAIYCMIGAVIGMFAGRMKDIKWLPEQKIRDYKIIAEEIFEAKNGEQRDLIRTKYRVNFSYQEHPKYRRVEFKINYSQKVGTCIIYDYGNGERGVLEGVDWTLILLVAGGFAGFFIGELLLFVMKKK